MEISMKTIIVEAQPHQNVASTPHHALVRLQTEVDQELAQATAKAQAEARARALPQKAAEPAPANRVRFAHD